MVTTGGHLGELYGEPSDDDLDDLLGDDADPELLDDLLGDDADPELVDDQADEGDDGTDVASMSADVWTDLSNHRNDPTASAVTDALIRLELFGPDAMADVTADRLGKPIEVTTHPTTGLPHLQYANPNDRRRHVGQPHHRDGEPIDLDDLGPAAQAWSGTSNHPRQEEP